MKMNRYSKWTLIAAPVALLGVMAGEAPVLAADLKAPFELENAQVLPPGVRNPRVKWLLMSVQDKFDGEGTALPLAQRLNKTVTWGDLLKAQKTDADRAMIQGVLDDPANGISDASATGSPGATTGTVNTLADIKVPVLAMGLTDRLTLAAALPVVNVQVSAATGFDKSEDGQKFVDAACNTNPAKCNEVAEKLNDAIQQKLANNGYEPIRSETISHIGDLKLVGKYQLLKEEARSFAVKAELTAPTGLAPNADKAVDVPTGDGQWDAGLGVVYDQRLLHDFRWNAYGSYTLQLAGELERRLPVGPGDTISETKELLRRDLGDVFAAGSSFSFEPLDKGVILGAGYSFQYIGATRYEDGTRASSEAYRWLEAESPFQLLHAATFTAGFQTIEWFRQKKFFYPFQTNVSYSIPLAGRNVTTNSVVSGELVLFF